MPVFKKIMKYLFILFLSFVLTKSKLEIKDINLKNELTINDLSETQYFHVIPSFEDNNIPNYLKIEFNFQDSYRITEDDILISFYAQDSHFINRKQISRNNNVIWLNKEQINKEFYLSVESFYSETIYDLNIYFKDIIVLELDQQYIYYVTEENKEMNFQLYGDIGWGDEGKDGFLLIWVKGDKDLITDLNEKNIYKHPKYNAYLIQINNTISYNYILKVKGIQGDMINVGHKFLYKNSNTTSIDFEIESFGILKKNILEKVCYWVDFTSHNFYVFIHDKQELYKLTPEQSDEDYDKDDDTGDKKYCLYLNDTFGLNEYFYSVQAVKIGDIFEKGKISPPQILGINYERELKENSIVGIIPKNTNDDYNFITYFIQEQTGLIKVSIFTCYFYPYCQIDSLKNEILINNFNSYSYSFTQDEYGKNIIPFSQKQNILLISCEKGLEKDYENICSFNVNIFTDKNKIQILPQTPLYQYIREKNEMSFLINHPLLNNIFDKFTKLTICLNIEIISGDSTISMINNKKNNITPFKYNNKIFYSFDYEKNNEYLLNIKGNKNTVLSVVVSYNDPNNSDDKINDIIIPKGTNYLFKFDKGNNFYNIKFENDIIKYDSINIQISYYFGFYALNCKFNVQMINNNKNTVLEEKQSYQDIFIYNESMNDIIYNITRNEKQSKECIFELNTFLFDEDYNMEYINGIILSINIPKILSFNKNNKILKFLFGHSEKEKDLKINLKLLNEEKYNIHLFYNNEYLDNYHVITKSGSIIIEAKDLQYNCMNYNQICKINFIVESQNLQTESSLEITISYDTNDSNKDNNDDNNSISKFLFVSIVTVLSIILLITLVILIILIFKCKNKNKNKSFNEEIDNLTYLNDKKNDN